MSVILPILIVLILSAASVGLHHLWYFAKYPGRIFGKVDQWIIQLEDREKKSNNPFIWQMLHKSIGSCSICNRQRFVDLLFIGYILLSSLPWWWYIFLYIVFSGLSYYLEAVYTFLTTNNYSRKKKTTQL